MNFKRGWILTLVLTGLLQLSACGQSTAFKMMLSTFYDSDFPTILPKEIADLNNPLLLDTREKKEFAVSHMKGAILVGYDHFSLANIPEKDKNKPIVVYCSIGVRSQDIGKQLKAAGFTQVYNLYGGIFHWVNEGNPVYQGNKPTNKVHAYNRIWGVWLTEGEKVY
ncbi:MAG: rhodanese-like domain-containing protein [Mongoliitalea sp.]